MRILVVNWLDRENPLAGGAEIHLHETFSRLVQLGHDVTLLASGWGGCDPQVDLDGIHVHRTGTRYTFFFAAAPYFLRHFFHQPFDVVVEDLNKVPVFTPCWTRLKIALVVHHLFGLTAFEEAGIPVASATWLLERPIPWIFRKTPTIAVSESTKEDLIRRGFRPEMIEVIPNGIDLDRYTPHPDNTRTEKPTVLYLGRLKKYKRVDLLLRAVDELSRKGVEVTLKIAGAGNDRGRLESLTSELGITDQVDFMGYVSEEKKLELLRTCWLHALTSSNEGWGISCIESSACATPTVASDSPGLRESVISGKTGLLVPHGDLVKLSLAIASLLSDHDTRQEMGERAREFAERFSWDTSAGAMEEFLMRVVTQSQPS
jgi:glycosyltransferase involved in cell wall biosynthesis